MRLPPRETPTRPEQGRDPCHWRASARESRQLGAKPVRINHVLPQGLPLIQERWRGDCRQGLLVGGQVPHHCDGLLGSGRKEDAAGQQLGEHVPTRADEPPIRGVSRDGLSHSKQVEGGGHSCIQFGLGLVDGALGDEGAVGGDQAGHIRPAAGERHDAYRRREAKRCR